jgi:hypothetical protein
MPPKAAAKGPQCIGRDCGPAILEAGKAMRLTEAQCDRACAEGSNLCTICEGREIADMKSLPAGKRWHGRIGGPIPPGSHIVGSQWNIDTAKKEALAAAKKATEAAKGSAVPAPVKAAAAAAVSSAAVVKVAAAAATTAARHESAALADVATHVQADQKLHASLRAVIAKATAEVAKAKEHVFNSSEDLHRRIAAAEAAAASAGKQKVRATVKAAKASAAGAPASQVKAVAAVAASAAVKEDAALERVETHMKADEKLHAALRAVIARTTADVAAAQKKVEQGSEKLHGKIASATGAAAAAEKKRLTATVKAAKATVATVAASEKAVKARRSTKKRTSSGPKQVHVIYKAASQTKNVPYVNRFAPGTVAPPGSPYVSNSNFRTPVRTNSSGAFSNAMNERRRAAVALASRPAAAAASNGSFFTPSASSSSGSSSSGSSSSGSSSSGSSSSGSSSSNSSSSNSSSNSNSNSSSSGSSSSGSTNSTHLSNLPELS